MFANYIGYYLQMGEQSFHEFISNRFSNHYVIVDIELLSTNVRFIEPII